MSSSKWIVGALALAAALTSSLAQARENDVQWSVTIGGPIGVQLYAQPQPQPVYSQPYVVYTLPVVVYQPRHHQDRSYQQPTRWDHDGDGVPNRRDPVYNPRWDRDGDGIPNRYDRNDRTRWDRGGYVTPHRYEHDDRTDRGQRDNRNQQPRRDRDGDSVPNWQDRGGRGR